MDQVERYNPPPNPAKITDSRFIAYARLYGTESWELDALNPDTLDTMIGLAIKQYLDPAAWDESGIKEMEYIDQLRDVRDRWSDIVNA